MPESNFNQTSMRELVRDAESQIESLARALDALKSTVRRLAAQVEMSESSAPSAGSGYGFGKPAQAESPPPVDEKPFDFSATAAALSRDLGEEPTPAISHQRPITPVEATPHSESEWYGVSDGGSWPVGPKHAESKEPHPAHSASVEQGDEPVALDEDTTTDVAEAVAAPKEPVAAATGQEWSFDPPEDDGQEPQPSWSLDAQDAQATTAEAMDAAAEEAARERRRSLSSGWPDEGIWSQSFDWPAMRSGFGETPKDAAADAPADDFRSMVDQVRAEIEAARASGETLDLDAPGEAEPSGENTRRAEVQRMVEEMRGRMSNEALEDDAFDGEGGGEGEAEAEAGRVAPAETSADDDEAKREEARRAVEQMRAELSGGSTHSVVFAPPVAKPAPSLDWSHMQADISGPPVIVVKDSEGRVELANVYDLLNRIECGESAALLNYTPHSVTVGLPIRAAMPTPEAVENAVIAVFGRSGVVDTDGVRITVEMGADVKRKRTEDAA